MKVRYLILVMALVAGLAFPAFAQQPADHQATPPLVQLLQSKGILTADEAAQLSHASSADDANAQLARLLVQKGLISTDDYSRMVAPSAVPASDDTSGTGHFLNAIIHIPTKASEPTPASSDPYTFGRRPRAA